MSRQTAFVEVSRRLYIEQKENASWGNYLNSRNLPHAHCNIFLDTPTFLLCIYRRVSLAAYDAALVLNRRAWERFENKAVYYLCTCLLNILTPGEFRTFYLATLFDSYGSRPFPSSVYLGLCNPKVLLGNFTERNC